MRIRHVLVFVLIVGLTPAAAADVAPVPRPGAAHSVPLYGRIVRTYDAPMDPFAPGHRGVDVAAPESSPVRASADGVVSFAGSVAGNLTVTVDHGAGLLTTCSFLGTVVAKRGDAVKRGDVVGTVGRGHPSSELPSHVHLSARRDGTYFDPLELYVGSSYSDLLAITG